MLIAFKFLTFKQGTGQKPNQDLARLLFCLLASVALGWYRVISDLGIHIRNVLYNPINIG